MTHQPDAFQIIRGDDYGGLANELPHIYLVGNLQRAVPHPFFRDDRLEIVRATYPTQMIHQRHWHQTLTEYTFLLSGRVEILLIPQGHIYTAKAGDLVKISPTQCIQLTTLTPLETLTVKVPSQHDKILCAACSRPCSYRLTPYQEDIP